MDINKDTNKAIRNIMKWTEAPEWGELQDQVFDEHTLLACEELDIELDEFGETMVEHGYMPMLYGLAFEDFISRRVPRMATALSTNISSAAAGARVLLASDICSSYPPAC